MNRQSLIQAFSRTMDDIARMTVLAHRGCATVPNMPPHAQLGVLFVLAYRGTLTTKELARHFDMTSSAVTQLVNSLVKEGLLERKEDKDDRRKVHISLTRKGKGVLARARTLRMRKMQELLQPLTEKEIKNLIDLHTKIAEHCKTVCQKTIK